MVTAERSVTTFAEPEKNLSDSGVPEEIAMAISGHKTRSIFDRYNIVSEARLEEAGALVVARHRKLTEGT